MCAETLIASSSCGEGGGGSLGTNSTDPGKCGSQKGHEVATGGAPVPPAKHQVTWSRKTVQMRHDDDAAPRRSTTHNHRLENAGCASSIGPKHNPVRCCAPQSVLAAARRTGSRREPGYANTNIDVGWRDKHAKLEEQHGWCHQRVRAPLAQAGRGTRVNSCLGPYVKDVQADLLLLGEQRDNFSNSQMCHGDDHAAAHILVVPATTHATASSDYTQTPTHCRPQVAQVDLRAVEVEAKQVEPAVGTARGTLKAPLWSPRGCGSRWSTRTVCAGVRCACARHRPRTRASCVGACTVGLPALRRADECRCRVKHPRHTPLTQRQQLIADNQQQVSSLET